LLGDDASRFNVVDAADGAPSFRVLVRLYLDRLKPKKKVFAVDVYNFSLNALVGGRRHFRCLNGHVRNNFVLANSKVNLACGARRIVNYFKLACVSNTHAEVLVRTNDVVRRLCGHAAIRINVDGRNSRAFDVNFALRRH